MNSDNTASKKKGFNADERKRIECDNCDRLTLKVLLTDGLCEMCDAKSQIKKQMFKKRMNSTNTTST